MTLTHPSKVVRAVSAFLVAVGALALLPVVTLVASAPPAGATSSEPYATWTTAQVDKYGPFSSSFPFDPNNPAPHPQVALLTSLSCPATTLCVAVDSSGSVVETQNDNYNAAVWTHMDIAGTNELTGVSCASTSMCAAVDAFGNIYASTQPTTASTWVNVSGVTYSTGTVIDFSGISCVGTSPNYVCAVVGNDSAGNGYLFVSNNVLSSAGWSSSVAAGTNSYVDVGHKINAASCPTIYFCLAGDAQGHEIYNATGVDFGGNFTTGSWTNAATGSADILSISCTVTASSYTAHTIAGLCAYGDTGGNIKTTTGALAFPDNTVGMVAPVWTGASEADGANHVTTISCVWSTTSMCEAGDNVGNFMASNKGAAWATVSSPGDSPNILEGISCASTSVCVAVDDIGTSFVTTSAPGNWTKYGPTVDGVPGLSVVDGVNPILSITCPSTTLCLAGDAQGRILSSTTPSAGTVSAWTRSTQLGGSAAPLSGLSCSSTTFCVAIDQGAPAHLYVSTSPTSSWTADGTLPNSGTVTGLSCPTTGLCVASEDGGALMYSTNPNASGGGTWANLPGLDGSNNINGISCASATLCVAVDNKGNMVVNSNGNPGAGAGSWATSSIDGANAMTSVSCVPNASLCVGVDGVGNIVYAPTAAYVGANPITDHTSWGTAAIAVGSNSPSATYGFTAVSCPSTQICLAIGLDNATNAVTGFVSQAQSNPTAGSSWCELETTSCGSGTVMTVDPGPIPQPVPPGASPYTVSALACSSGAACEAVDNAGNILTGTSGGLTVSTTTMPAGVVNEPYNSGVAYCITASGGVPNYRWQITGALPPGLSYAQSASCNGNLSGSLAISGTPTSVGTFSFSVAVSDSSNPPVSSSATISVTIMSNWTAPQLVDSGTSTGLTPTNLPAGQISCVSSSLCLEADGGGRVLTYNGTSWSAPTEADGSGYITGVSCATSSFCALVDSCGNAVIGSSSNGGATWTWGTPTLLTGTRCSVGYSAAPSTQISLTAISCVSASPVFCVAVGGSGEAYGYNGTSWMQGWGWAPDIDGVNTLTSVSCVSSALCVATDNQGHWLDYGDTVIAAGHAGVWTADGAINGAFGANPTITSCYDPSGVAGNLFCAAVDKGETGTLSSGGPGWGSIADTDAALNTDSVSCTAPPAGGDTEFCIAVDSSGNAFGYNGTQWDTCPTIAGGGPCAAPPPGWSNTVNGPAFDFASVACTATPSLDCFAGNGTGNGAAIPPNQSGGEVMELLGTSDAWCPGSAGCPGAPAKSDILDSIDSMSCPSTTLCIAGTANGQVLAGVVPTGGSPNMGSAADWTDVVGPSYPAPGGLQPAGPVVGMSCATSGSGTNCFGGSGDNILYSTTPQLGDSWQSVTSADTSGHNLTGISCPSTSLCVGVDSGGHVAASSAPTSGASGWSTSTSLTGITDLTGISCLPDGSNTFCVATATGGTIAWTDTVAANLSTAGSWTAAVIDGANNLSGISCTSTTMCVAVDNMGNEVWSANPKVAWTVTGIDPSSSAPSYPLTSVSCLTTTFCVAGDQYGNVLGTLNPVPSSGSPVWWVLPVDEGSTSGNATYPNSTTTGYFGPAVSAASCSPTSSSSPNSLCVVGDSYGRILTSASSATLTITPGGPYTGTDGAAIQPITLAASGGSGTYTWSPINSLPPGLSLSSGGVISGTPTSASNYSFEVQAQDSSSPPQTATATFSMVISTATLGVSTTSLPGGTLGGSYSATVQASGGTPPYAWALASGSTLPTGLKLTSSSSNAVISGVPSATGSTTFTVQVTDSASPVNTATAKLTITVTTTTTLVITSTSANPPSGFWTVGTNSTVTLTASGGSSPYSWALGSGSSLPPGLNLASSGAISGTPTSAGSLDAVFTVTDSSSPVQVASAEFQLVVEANGCQGSSCGGGGGGGCSGSSCPLPQGYWMVGADGGVFNFPQASLPLYGSATGISGGAAGMVATPDGQGYWVVSKTGTVEGFGDASSACTSASLTNVIGIISTADGKGCWIADAAGDVAAEGDATSYGSISSISGLVLAAPIVGMTVTPDGGGYWLLGGDGGVFTFGDAKYFGSTSQLSPLQPPGGNNSAEPLDKPVVGIASTGDGKGYWEVAADGGIFSFGDAAFYGSQGGTNLFEPVVGMVVTPSAHGYWLVAADGGIFTHGDATYYGGLGGQPLFSPIVGMAGP